MAGILPTTRSRTPGSAKNRCCNWKSCCILIIFLIVLTLLGIGLGLGIPALLKMKNQRVLSVGEAVERILENADLTQDPCTNFYNYACGNFAKNRKFIGNENKIDVSSEIKHKINQQLEELLVVPKRASEPIAYHKVKDFYSSCMDMDMRNRFELEPLLKLLNKIGGWPVKEGDNWDNVYATNWIQLHSIIYKAGIVPNFLIDISVITDIFNPEQNILYISQASLGLPLSVFFHGPNIILKAYHQLMIDVAKYFGAEAETAEREMNEVFAFENKLAKTMDNREELYAKKSIKEIESSIPDLHLLEFVHAVLPYKVEGNEAVLIKHTQYLMKFNNLLKQTDMRTLTNYIIWRLVVTSLQYLDSKAVELFNGFNARAGGAQEDQKTKCLGDTLFFLNSGLSLMYVKNYMNQDIKQTVNSLANDMRDVFLTQIPKMKWLDNATQEKAIAKIKEIEFYVAYPEDYLHQNLVNDLYESIHVQNNTFFQNVMELKLREYDKNLWTLRRTIKKTSYWNIETALLLNRAKYSLTRNSIELFIIDVQLMYYDMNEPMSFNVGALGSLIGHELFHSIDKKGGQHDFNGGILSWWSHETTLNFINISECFIKKYNTFEEPQYKIPINGSLTLAENMADYVGVRTAYYTFQKYIKNKGGAQRLPEKFPWTEEKLFWLSYANMYCERNKVEHLSWSQYGIHSPFMFRVNGPLTSLPEFVHDFNCNINSEMAMKNLRCKV